VKLGYARVSTSSSAQDISIDEQRRDLLAHGCDEVIVERRSAFKGRRPEWDRLWALVGSGNVTEVVVVDQSRLSRSGDDMQFLQMCGIHGVTVRQLIGGVIEVDSYGGFVAAGVISLINQADSRLKAAKVRDGIRRRREQGHYACGKLPFGYALVDGRPAPHPQHFEEAREMWLQLLDMELNVSGWIRRTKMPWTVRGVWAWIRNPMLRGCVRGQWNAVEPVITWQEWERAKSMMVVRRGLRGSAAHRVHLFTGLVRCEQCGKALHTVRDRAYDRLQCRTRHCDWYGRTTRVSTVRERVIAELTGLHRELARLHAERDAVETDETRQIRAEVEHLQHVAHLPGVAALIEQQQAQLKALAQQPAGPDLEALEQLLADPKTLEQATDDELRAIVIEFIGTITYLGAPDQLRITLR